MLPWLLLILTGALGVLASMVSRARRKAAHLAEELQRVEQERQMVIDFMQILANALAGGANRQELWERIVHAAVQSTGALSAAGFALESGGMLRGVAIEGLFPPHRHLPESSRMKLTTRAKYIEHILKSETFSIQEGIVGAAARARRGELVEDATVDPRIHQHDDPLLLVRSIIVCPVVFQEELLGVLAVVNPADGMPFNRTDFSLMENLAKQAGLALRNADILHLQMEKSRLDMELELARNIQGLLLPRHFPDHPLLEIGATYIPARKVGGDLYDVFSLAPNLVGVAVADVSGKGVPASLLMAICQTHLRHFARQTRSPAEVLARINLEMTSAGMRRDKFITMVYGIIDLEQESLVLARAGHERPLLLQRVGPAQRPEVVQTGGEGMALGMVPPRMFDPLIQDTRMAFRAGDILVLYTDGVTEIANSEDTEFGFARLADAVRVLKDQPVAGLQKGILEHLERFAGKSSYDDDLTLLAIRRR